MFVSAMYEHSAQTPIVNARITAKAKQPNSSSITSRTHSARKLRVHVPMSSWYQPASVTFPVITNYSSTSSALCLDR